MTVDVFVQYHDLKSFIVRLCARRSVFEHPNSVTLGETGRFNKSVYTSWQPTTMTSCLFDVELFKGLESLGFKFNHIGWRLVIHFRRIYKHGPVINDACDYPTIHCFSSLYNESCVPLSLVEGLYPCDKFYLLVT